jgi:monothiol glutaredoxin
MGLKNQFYRMNIHFRRGCEEMGEQETISQIQKVVDANAVCLFMKGTPDAPMCGFSAQVVQILGGYGVPYHGVNVLEDYDLREGIKKFANWPTIPQLYVKGKFVGGCDITVDLHRKGKLQAILDEAK